MSDDPRDEILVDKKPPSSIESEQAVLGSIMIDSEALLKCIEMLEPEMFYNTKHKAIYQAALDLYEEESTVDYLTVCTHLEKTGEESSEEGGWAYYVTQLAESVPSAASVGYYAKIVREKYFYRKVLMGAAQVQSGAYNQKPLGEILMQFQEEIIYKVTDKQASGDFMNMETSLTTTFESVDKIVKSSSRGGMVGIPCGFSDVDLMLGGFHAGELTYVAGQSSKGKTSFVMQAALNTAKAGNPIGISSYEMTTFQLCMRLVCTEAKVDSHKFRTGRFTDEDWKKMMKVIQPLSELPIHICDDNSINALQLRTKIEKLVREKGIVAHVIDYVQLIPLPGKYEAMNRDRQVTKISNTLKSTAKKLNIPVIGVSTLNRLEPGKRPGLWNLRESGSLEYDADVVIFIYDPYDSDPTPENKNVREIIVAKQRNGPIGTVKLDFEPEFLLFKNKGLPNPKEPPAEYYNPASEENKPMF